jgi:hypothetical protein
VALVAGAFAAVSSAGGAYWTPRVFENRDVPQALAAFPGRMWVSLGGLHWYEKPGSGGTIWTVTTALWAALFVLALGALVAGLRPGRWLTLRQACLYGMAASCLCTLFVNGRLFGYRYLLPSSAAFILWLGLVGGDWLGHAGWRRRLAQVLIAAAAVAACGTAATVGPLAPPAMMHDGRVHSDSEVHELVAELGARGIHHVYSFDPMLHWSIIFVSREGIMARWVHPTDRIPAYPLAVDRALFAGKPVAVVGWKDDAGPLRQALDRAGLTAVRLEPVAGRFFILRTSDPTLLRGLRFYLNEGEAAVAPGAP